MCVASPCSFSLSVFAIIRQATRCTTSQRGRGGSFPSTNQNCLYRPLPILSWSLLIQQLCQVPAWKQNRFFQQERLWTTLQTRFGQQVLGNASCSSLQSSFLACGGDSVTALRCAAAARQRGCGHPSHAASSTSSVVVCSRGLDFLCNCTADLEQELARRIKKIQLISTNYITKTHLLPVWPNLGTVDHAAWCVCCDNLVTHCGMLWQFSNAKAGDFCLGTAERQNLGRGCGSWGRKLRGKGLVWGLILTVSA